MITHREMKLYKRLRQELGWEPDRALDKELLSAVDRGDLDEAAMLLKQQADPDAVTPACRSACLHIATYKPNVRMMHLLLRYLADPNVETREHDRTTPLLFAAQCCPPMALGMLLEAGANITHQDKAGNTAMHRAAFVGRIHNIRFLLDRGLEPTITNTDGRTVVDVAKKHGHGYLVAPLVAYYQTLPQLDWAHPFHKADLLAPKDEQGRTVLDHPATWHHFERLKDRLEAQGEWLTKKDLLAENHQGRSWLERAAECGALPEVLDYLGERGEHITAGDLFKPNGESTRLLATLIETANVHHAFRPIDWVNDPRKMRECLQRLPEEGKQLVSNPHLLCIQASRLAAQRQRGRDGETRERGVA